MKYKCYDCGAIVPDSIVVMKTKYSSSLIGADKYNQVPVCRACYDESMKPREPLDLGFPGLVGLVTMAIILFAVLSKVIL